MGLPFIEQKYFRQSVKLYSAGNRIYKYGKEETSAKE